MRDPSAGAPLPDGRPAPSGRTLRSQAAISAGVSGSPRLGVWEKAIAELRTMASTTRHCPNLCVYMFHLPAALDGPTRNRVVMLVGKRGYCWNFRHLATRSNEFGTSWLRVTGFIPGPAL